MEGDSFLPEANWRPTYNSGGQYSLVRSDEGSRNMLLRVMNDDGGREAKGRGRGFYGKVVRRG